MPANTNADAWATYLTDMVAKALMTPERRAQIESFLVNELQGQCPPTQGQIDERGTMFLVWDLGKHHLDIEFYLDGTHEYFYRNREAELLHWSDEPEQAPSAVLLSVLPFWR